MTSKWVGSEGSYLTLEAFDQLIGDGLDLNGSPSELMSVPQVAKDYGLGSLTVKRDDLINSLCGGTKVRKLNYLLADGRFKKAATWHAVGSIGSGNLVTLTRFAEHLGKRLEIHCFGVPITEGTTENLSQLVMDHVNIRYYPNRIDLCFGLASYFVGQMSQVILPTGSTNGDGMLGLVRAGIELSDQIRAGDCPKPDEVYVPLGSGGITAGLAVGLALGGTDTTVCAVSVVERWLSTRWRVNSLIKACTFELSLRGIEIGSGVGAVPVEINRGFVGKGYGHSTAASQKACEIGKEQGVNFEEVYTGKTFAALLKTASAKAADGKPKNVIIWHTPHASEVSSPPKDWQERLPEKLKALLENGPPKGPSRRKWILGSAALVTAAALGSRCGTYSQIDGWNGAVLANWEARVLQAGIEAVAPPELSSEVLDVIVRSAPKKIDDFLGGMPAWFIREVHGLFTLIEHGTILDFRLNRFTELSVEKRRAALEELHGCGWLMTQGYKGIRDLCLMAIYLHPSSWEAIQYEGPRLTMANGENLDKISWLKYESLKAGQGVIPR